MTCPLYSNHFYTEFKNIVHTREYTCILFSNIYIFITVIDQKKHNRVHVWKYAHRRRWHVNYIVKSLVAPCGSHTGRPQKSLFLREHRLIQVFGPIFAAL